MQYTLNNKLYSFPATLEEITVGQKIVFQEEHGRLLEERARTIAAITDTFEKEIEQTHLDVETAVRTFAFYAGIPFDQVASTIDMNGILHIYNTCREQLIIEEQSMELQPSYQWKGETWFPAVPDSKPSENFSINDYAACSNILRSIYSFGLGKWETLPYLCAVYLRKENEPFTPELVADGSERLALMRELPLSIALAIGSMLNGFLVISNNIVNQKAEIL